MIADWLTSSGLGALKPVLSALVLPPVPLLALAFAGAWLARARPRTGRGVTALACIALWLSCCAGTASWVEAHGLSEPAPLDATQREALRQRGVAGDSVAIVVLGGGTTDRAPEFDDFDLSAASLARLRYAVWLGRQTGLPIAASGGRGWRSVRPDAPAEATRMAAIAQAEWGLPLRWTETDSRDTHENAVNTLALLQPAGVHEVVLVTHGRHMPRALREFKAAAAASGASGALRVTAAPMGSALSSGGVLADWLPSGEGALRLREVLHEVLAGFADRR